jgi:hypothetical protein
MRVTTGYCWRKDICRGGGSGRCWVGLLCSRYRRERKMAVRFAGESVYGLRVRGEVWQEWAADGAISAVLVRGFVPKGDPGETCFTLTRTEIVGDNGGHLLGAKRKFRMISVNSPARKCWSVRLPRM